MRKALAVVMALAAACSGSGGSVLAAVFSQAKPVPATEARISPAAAGEEDFRGGQSLASGVVAPGSDGVALTIGDDTVAALEQGARAQGDTANARAESAQRAEVAAPREAEERAVQGQGRSDTEAGREPVTAAPVAQPGPPGETEAAEAEGGTPASRRQAQVMAGAVRIAGQLTHAPAALTGSSAEPSEDGAAIRELIGNAAKPGDLGGIQELIHDLADSGERGELSALLQARTGEFSARASEDAAAAVRGLIGDADKPEGLGGIQELIEEVPEQGRRGELAALLQARMAELSPPPAAGQPNGGEAAIPGSTPAASSRQAAPGTPFAGQVFNIPPGGRKDGHRRKSRMTRDELLQEVRDLEVDIRKAASFVELGDLNSRWSNLLPMTGRLQRNEKEKVKRAFKDKRRELSASSKKEQRRHLPPGARVADAAGEFTGFPLLQDLVLDARGMPLTVLPEAGRSEERLLLLNQVRAMLSVLDGYSAPDRPDIQTMLDEVTSGLRAILSSAARGDLDIEGLRSSVRRMDSRLMELSASLMGSAVSSFPAELPPGRYDRRYSEEYREVSQRIRMAISRLENYRPKGPLPEPLRGALGELLRELKDFLADIAGRRIGVDNLRQRDSSIRLRMVRLFGMSMIVGSLMERGLFNQPPTDPPAALPPPAPAELLKLTLAETVPTPVDAPTEVVEAKAPASEIAPPAPLQDEAPAPPDSPLEVAFSLATHTLGELSQLASQTIVVGGAVAEELVSVPAPSAQDGALGDEQGPVVEKREEAPAPPNMPADADSKVLHPLDVDAAVEVAPGNKLSSLGLTKPAVDYIRSILKQISGQTPGSWEVRKEVQKPDIGNLLHYALPWIHQHRPAALRTYVLALASVGVLAISRGIDYTALIVNGLPNTTAPGIHPGAPLAHSLTGKEETLFKKQGRLDLLEKRLDQLAAAEIAALGRDPLLGSTALSVMGMIRILQALPEYFPLGGVGRTPAPAEDYAGLQRMLQHLIRQTEVVAEQLRRVSPPDQARAPGKPGE